MEIILTSPPKTLLYLKTAGVASVDIPKGFCVRNDNGICYINDKENNLLISGVTDTDYIQGQVVSAIYYGDVMIFYKGHRVSVGDYITTDSKGSVMLTEDPSLSIGVVKSIDSKYVKTRLNIGGRS
jgi:hypothetical protein